MIWFKKKNKEIPDKDFLFTRIHKRNLSKGFPKADAFKNTPFNVNSNELSSDWDKYTTAEKCRLCVELHSIPGKPKKNPDDYFIWKMNVGKIRKDLIPTQEVLHTPSKHNRAHSTIRGRKPANEGVNNAEFRSIIIEIGQWEIAP